MVPIGVVTVAEMTMAIEMAIVMVVVVATVMAIMMVTVMVIVIVVMSTTDTNPESKLCAGNSGRPKRRQNDNRDDSQRFEHLNGPP
jgi:hypothetical protein